jgi:hypothetical protein
MVLEALIQHHPHFGTATPEAGRRTELISVFQFSREPTHMKNGGARSPGGQKADSPKRTKRRSWRLKLAARCRARCLLEAMRYHHDLALAAPKAERGPHYDAAADIATRAAPYVHPRLLASTVTVRRVSEMTDDELAIATADVRAEIAAAKAAAKAAGNGRVRGRAHLGDKPTTH